MKNRFKYRKAWEAVAEELGMVDRTVQAFTTNKDGKEHALLVNNFRRFVEGMLKLTLAEQEAKLKLFQEKMEEVKKEQAQAKKEMQESIKDIKIEKKDTDIT